MSPQRNEFHMNNVDLEEQGPNIAGPPTNNVVIVGMGDMSYGLCRLYSNHHYLVCDGDDDEEGQFYKLCITKPGLTMVNQDQVFHDTGVPVVPDMETALSNANIVILAIPAGAPTRQFMDKYGSMIRPHAVLVDLANPDSDLDVDLATIVEESKSTAGSFRYVKAFNDNGAVDLLLDEASSKKLMVTTMCGKDVRAVRMVEKFAKLALGYDIVKIVPFHKYNALVDKQKGLPKDYIHSAYISLVVFAFSEFYAVLRYNVYKGYSWTHLPLQVTNKAICWTALYCFALCQVPGMIGRVYNLFYGKLQTKPRWLVYSFQLRKPLGIIALWYLVIHIIESLLLFNQKYYGKFYEDPSAYASKMNVKGELSFFFGIIGSGLYGVMAVCSLPSVGSQLSRATWEFVYGPVAWVALLFGTTHVLTMGVKGWVVKKNNWPGDLPPITMISVLIPMLVLGLKIVQYIIVRVVHPARSQSQAPQLNSKKAKSDDGDATESFSSNADPSMHASKIDFLELATTYSC